jgi:AmmeMemoRadiSam system protein B
MVGVTLGAGDAERCRRFATVAEVLQGRRDRPLLVISIDLNHYASDRENRRLDAIALDAVERLDAGDVYRIVRDHKISMCGLLPTIVVLETPRQLDAPWRCERVG